ncbi:MULTISPECIES: DapH/DapD/GlmU-related protein [unclassified Gemella]|uniref:DapH/DapD/GlmU-related protein n=1 Tax=unclassified Gemella TaxID=2624949 RepID=UPI001C05CA84|nr:MULTISPECIES: DapH/DapD/GlmU-related protein [unclassified Gemella]MBU0278978.1 sugar O-acetyltransferase [Gemella sp. zg-1178]QWQ38758.1 sugar O-acetyltransferase [Gemella sp. zg-570]
MNLEKFLEYMEQDRIIKAGSEIHEYMHYLSQEAIKITMEINNKYHSQEEIKILMEELTGRKIDDSFVLFPPFYTDCGKNIQIGKNVFINADCKFQDQGGIEIGDGSLIGHGVVLATINHELSPEKRGNMLASRIKIGKNVWIGSNSTICQGVEIGDGAVVAAGSVVTKNVEKNTLVGGVPARFIKNIKE